MNQIIWLIFRRMRPPLLLLVCVYSISVIGMVLVPGPVQNGEMARMNFFEAIYFISYTSTTIGFGELPYTFSSAQRLWAMICIYLSVVAWLYSIGSILSLVQDPAFRQAMVERRFTRNVAKIKEPFYLICGYGEAGAALVQALTHYYIRLVVIDKNPDSINELSLQDQKYRVFVPGLCADAEIPEVLLEGGLKHPMCARVIALTESDQVNLKIAITSKLLNPQLKVVARAEDQSTVANMDSFGTEDIIDAFEEFGETLALALHSPDQYLLQERLTGISHEKFQRPRVPPRGKWVVCGYGRFGRNLVRHLEEEGLPTVVIESNGDIVPPAQGLVLGRGTEASTLLEADIKNAAGIVAGTDDDSNNLSIIMTARELNPSLFIVARQNMESNKAIFEALDADIVMNPSHILASKIRCLLTTPRLAEFLKQVRDIDNQWARDLNNVLEQVIGKHIVPDVWTLKITEQHSPAVLEALDKKLIVHLRHLLTNPYFRDERLYAYPLLLMRGDDRILQPDEAMSIQAGDRILFCGINNAYSRMRVTANDLYVIYHVISNRDLPRSGLLRWIMNRRTN